MTQKTGGYCHFNNDGGNTTFNIEMLGEEFQIDQLPSNRSIGHGAVVWDAAVVFSKYTEVNNKDFEPKKWKGKRVLELGSGTGLAGKSPPLLSPLSISPHPPDVRFHQNTL